MLVTLLCSLLCFTHLESIASRNRTMHACGTPLTSFKKVLACSLVMAALADVNGHVQLYLNAILSV
jgi:hypothetical protein